MAVLDFFKAALAVLLVALFFLAVLFFSSTEEGPRPELQAKMKTIKEGIYQYQKENDALVKNIRALRLSNRYIAYLARKKFDMISSNEKIIEFIPTESE